MSKIRVAHIIGKWVGGGVESVVMNYYRNIDREKVQFDFICDSDSTNIPYDEIEDLGGRVFLVPPYQKLFSYIKALKKIFKEENYKIVHSHINTLSIFPLYVAKKADVKTRIAHSHSTTNNKEFKRNLMKQTLKHFSKLNATHYFACSEVAGRYLFGDKTYNEGKITIINNAIDLDKFKYDEAKRKEKRVELNIKNNTLVIGHIGRFMTQKNHEFLINIFKEIQEKEKDSILLLIGQGPLQDRIKAKVKELGLNGNVKFLGQRKDVSELYQAMDVFVLPSLYEGLGLTLIEAQCSNLPCVVSNYVPNEVKLNENLLFLDLECSKTKWSYAINSLFKNNKRSSLVNEKIINNYNINNEAIKLTEFYLDGEKYD